MKNLGLLVVVFAVVFASCNNAGNTKVVIKNFNDSVSYAIGNDIAKSFERSKLDDINVDIVYKAMKDAYAKDATIMDSAAIAGVMQKFQVQMREKAEADRIAENKEKFKANLEEGKLFLTENKTKER